GDDWLTVKAHPGNHVYEQQREIPLRYYEVKTSKGMKLLFLGDHDYTRSMVKLDTIDLAFVKCGGVSPNYSDEEAMKHFVKQVPLNYFIPGHINELGHPVKGGRISYENAFQSVADIEIPHTILAWGESLNLPIPEDKSKTSIAPQPKKASKPRKKIPKKASKVFQYKKKKSL
ncbi:hypothetical protein ACFL27_28090, partial [candidate division CSSED10-310 bacterium]